MERLCVLSRLDVSCNGREQREQVEKHCQIEQVFSLFNPFFVCLFVLFSFSFGFYLWFLGSLMVSGILGVCPGTWEQSGSLGLELF